MHFRRLGLHRYAQRVFRLVVSKAAPCCRGLGKDDGPFILIGDHMKAINPPGQRLAFNADRIAEFNGGVFICARALNRLKKQVATMNAANASCLRMWIASMGELTKQRGVAEFLDGKPAALLAGF